MKNTLINNSQYLVTWINNNEKIYKESNSVGLWERVILSYYPNIDVSLYKYLDNKIRQLEVEIGDNFELSLLSSIGNLGKIIIKTNELEEKFKSSNKINNNLNKMSSLLEVYTTLAQGPFFDEIDIINSLISIYDRTNHFNKNMRPQINFLSGKKRPNLNFSEFTDLVDVDIRNATDHNHVVRNNDDFVFEYFDEHGKKNSKRINYSLFKNYLNKLFLGVKTFIVVIVDLIKNRKITNYEILQYVVPTKRFDWLKIFLSTYEVTCTQLEIQVIFGKRKQILVSFDGIDAGKQDRLSFLLNSAIKIRSIVDIQFDRMFLSFSSPKTLESFFTIDAEKVIKYINNEISYEVLKNIALENAIIYAVNDDASPLQEIKYNEIPGENYLIKDIEDVSVEDKKVFKARVYIPNLVTPYEIKLMMGSITEILKMQYNSSVSSYKIKYGSMPADRVYVEVYKSENGKKNLSSNNDNFITIVQYDKDESFEIQRNNPYLEGLKSEQDNKIEFRWNPNFISKNI